MKKDNDILVRIIIKKTPAKFAYEAMRAQRTDFPTLTVAASTLGKLAIGARPMKAMVLPLPKEGEDISALVPTAKNLRGSKEYRSHLVTVLTRRVLAQLED